MSRRRPAAPRPAAPEPVESSAEELAGALVAEASIIDVRAARRRALKAAARIIRARFKRPERLTVTQWADRYRWLPSTSANPGKYNSARAPYQREPMDVIGEAARLGFRRVVLMWASQVGKSLVIENAIGHTIHLRPRPIVVVQPKEAAAVAWSKERFGPMVDATPVLRERISEGASRDAENTLSYKAFPGGFLALASANSPADLAARSAARVFCDEVDRYAKSAGSEGKPVGIVERRMGAIDDAVLVMASTPGDKGESEIEPAFEAGDQRYYYVPCPVCGHEQRFVFGTPTSPGGLRWEKGRPETAWYRCEAQGCRIQEWTKALMLERGRWIATNPNGRYPSFHLNALYSPFGGTTWAIIAEMWEAAQGKPMELKVFVNTILAETWTEPGEVIEAHTLLARLETFPAEHLPAGVRVLTAGVDVQSNRLEFFVWGWGFREESWLLRREVIVGDPNSDDPWLELEQHWRESYATADGKRLTIKRMFVDSNYNSNRVYRWCRVRHRHGVYACRGVGGEGVPFIGRASVQGDDRCLVYPVGVDAAKTSFLRSRLYVAKPEAAVEGDPMPRYVHLPAEPWCDVALLEGLTAEKLVRRLVRGRLVREWVKIHERNEPLDCQDYAHAALHSLGVRELIRLGVFDAGLGKSRSPAADARAATRAGDAGTEASAAAPPADETTAPADDAAAAETPAGSSIETWPDAAARADEPTPARPTRRPHQRRRDDHRGRGGGGWSGW